MFREGDPLLRLINFVDGPYVPWREGSRVMTASQVSLLLRVACNMGMNEILSDLDGHDTNKYIKL